MGHSVALTGQIEYHVVDATEEEELHALSQRRFESAVSAMELLIHGFV
ncbi:MAG: hypothetical protein GY759_03120 [Chloroflexi bacterium]|nr:hypothetical protein [Chloroflexota bacterium]